MTLIVPSILSADFTRLGEQVDAVTKAGADRIQVDVMDGHFVPNISIGTLGVEAVRRATTLPIEAHLMITSPARFVDDFLRAGANIIIVHREVLPDPRPLLTYIREHGAQPAIAISPETPAEAITDYLEDVAMILVMTVHPGFGGQDLISDCLAKVTQVRQALQARNLTRDIEVDGGIHAGGTAAQAVAAGANVLVAGSAIYNKDETPAEAMQRLKASIGE